MSFKTKLADIKRRQFDHNSFNQAVFQLIEHPENQSATAKNTKIIKRTMRFQQFWYYLGLIAQSAGALYLGYQPYVFAGDFANTAFTIPYSKITNGQLQQLILSAQGRYLMGAVIFGVALNWVLHRPWKQAPHHKQRPQEYAKEVYPKLKAQAKVVHTK